MITSLKDLLILEAQDMHSAEQQLVEALPRMIEAAQSATLRQAFEDHLAESRAHLSRVQDALQELEADPAEEECEAMQGLVAEADELLTEELAPEILDAALIVAALKIEHYEMASYSALIALCDACGCDRVGELFSANLRDEDAASDRLQQIAETEVNMRAAQAEDAQS
jgi:ferritin-like metal-binding protein YciE